MTKRRKRTIVRRAASLAGALVLIVMGYVGSWLGFCFCHGAGWVGPRGDLYVGPVFYPLGVYMQRGYPGGSMIHAMADIAFGQGEKLLD